MMLREIVSSCCRWCLKIALFAVMCAFPYSVSAQTTEFELNINSGSFAGYRYQIFAVDNLTPDAKVVLRSTADSYLVLQSPSGTFATNDDHSLDIPELGADAGFSIPGGTEGRWIIVATTLHSGTSGKFELQVTDIEVPAAISALDEDTLPDSFLEEAFRARDVESDLLRRNREIEELVEQLSLPSYRVYLDSQVLGREADAGEANDKVRERIASLNTKLDALKSAENETEKLDQQRDLILGLITDELESVESGLASATATLQSQELRSEALRFLQSRLARLSEAAETVNKLEEELLGVGDIEQLRSLSDALVEARRVFDDLAREIGETLLDSNIVIPRRFGGYVPSFEDRMRAQSSTHGLGWIMGSGLTAGDQNSLIRGRFGGLVGGAAFGSAPSSNSVERIEYSSILPRLLPWPPPAPSARAGIARSLISSGGSAITLGNVSDTLREALREAGYSGPGYYGVPGGFAMVTRIEQTDHVGRPLADQARWATEIRTWKRFSLSGYLRALLTAEPGFYRVIALITTDEAFSADGAPARLETIQSWSREGVNDLSAALREAPFTSSHNLTVFVYEFEKHNNSSDPEVRVPGRNLPENHLQHTRFAGSLY